MRFQAAATSRKITAKTTPQREPYFSGSRLSASPLMGKTREANNPLIIAPSAGAGGGGGSSGALARWLKRYLILNYSLNHGSEVCGFVFQIDTIS